MDKETLIQGIVENLARCQRPAIDAGWKSVGLSHAQIGVLYLLFYHNGASVKETAEFLGVTKSAVTQMIDQLTSKNLVSRQEDPADRRIVRLGLTSEGVKTLKKLAKYKYAGLRSALNDFDTKELEQLYFLHQKMAKNIK